MCTNLQKVWACVADVCRKNKKKHTMHKDQHEEDLEPNVVIEQKGEVFSKKVI